eukprot:scaffold1522_cov340-Prasinococcus_capsulatus_cf.AAC.5
MPYPAALAAATRLLFSSTRHFRRLVFCQKQLLVSVKWVRRVSWMPYLQFRHPTLFLKSGQLVCPALGFKCLGRFAFPKLFFVLMRLCSATAGRACEAVCTL